MNTLKTSTVIPVYITWRMSKFVTGFACVAMAGGFREYARELLTVVVGCFPRPEFAAE